MGEGKMHGQYTVVKISIVYYVGNIVENKKNACFKEILPVITKFSSAGNSKIVDFSIFYSKNENCDACVRFFPPGDFRQYIFVEHLLEPWSRSGHLITRLFFPGICLRQCHREFNRVYIMYGILCKTEGRNPTNLNFCLTIKCFDSTQIYN